MNALLYKALPIVPFACEQDGKVEVPVETIAEVRSRLPKGTVKRVLFDALEEAGPAGLNIASLVDAVQVDYFLAPRPDVPHLLAEL